MQTRLSLRSYTLNPRSHRHEYAQVVIPLQGKIRLALGFSGASEHLPFRFESELGVKQAVVIPPGHIHRFSSHQESRFLVADIHNLPAHLTQLEKPLLALSNHFFDFCLFAEQQLNNQLDPDIEQPMGHIFYHLLSQQQPYARKDKRIELVVDFLKKDLSHTPELSQLSDIACLSLSHFKQLFVDIYGQPPLQHLRVLRMQKARALLSHSDTPIAIIAQKVGYTDASAFSRSFRQYWGQPPKDYRAR
ncbi:AraC family transcriptional regulator [Oceanospirillum sp.]|uniref:helix-turn-helix transcriptional regulator n=1 Tax=Oceanospirillum sp. TaxID=2021254 RepID=UPI003A9173B0